MSAPLALDPVLRVDHVSRSFASDPPTVALADVSLEIAAGEFVAIVGPSGSGKSTLLGIMGTLERPSTGRVSLLGTDVTTLSDAALSALRSTAIGFVFQQFFLLDGLSVLENVGQALLYQGVPAAERSRRATTALERVGLGHRLQHRPGQLSGGERQRVAIARAVVGESAIVLADEPTGSLDSAAGAGILDLLRALNASGTTIALITHSDPVAAAATRLIRILDGRVAEPGNASGPAGFASGPAGSAAGAIASSASAASVG